MPEVQIDFDKKVNTSAQIGDEVYWILAGPNGEFDWANKENIQNVGYPISGVGINSDQSGETGFINIQYPAGSPTWNPPPPLAFVMFAKDNRANMSSLVGYYAKAKFENNSKERAELFIVSAEIKESSQ